MTETLTLNNHLEKFDKVINCKWKEINDVKRQIDTKVKILEYYYRQPNENKDFVLLELFNMYLLGGYDKKYDPARGNLLTYVTVFIDSHLDTMLDQRRKRDLWEQGERIILQNGSEKRIRFKSCDIYDKYFTEPLPNDDRDIQFSDPEDPESLMLRKEKLRLFWRFAKEKDRINEAKIILGLEDLDTISKQTSTSNNTIRIRVSRLIEDFNTYYKEL